jgi:hypothetical protein
VWTRWICIVIGCPFEIRSGSCFVVDRLSFLSGLMIEFFAVSAVLGECVFITDRSSLPECKFLSIHYLLTRLIIYITDDADISRAMCISPRALRDCMKSNFFRNGVPPSILDS